MNQLELQFENEEWKPIEGYEGLYEVSNYGRVKSLKHNKIKILKQSKNIDGYIVANLYNNNCITHYVHRLVAKAFIPNPNNLPCINHIDENHSNNYYLNLEWCSYSYNNTFGTRIKRQKETQLLNGYNHNSKQIKCVETNCSFKSISEASKQTNVNASHIGHCCNGIRKTAGGYHWEFV